MNYKKISNRIIKKYSSIAKYILPNSFKQVLSEQTTKDLDIFFFKLLSDLNVISLIECGANEASASMKAIEKGINSLGIEANPFTFEKITPKSSKKFSKLNFGLGEKNGSMTFYIPKSNQTAANATFKPKQNVIYDTRKIEVKKLDDVLKETDYINSPFALWIDVEGMQKEVLNGAIKTLQNDNCKIIKIEVEDQYLFGNQKWLANDVINFFDKLDYEIVFRDFEYEKQNNLFLVNRNLSLSLIDKFLKIFYNKIKPIGIKDTIQSLYNKKDYKREIKAITLFLLGKRIGHKISAMAGSVSSRKLK
jgi:FkbM family methyltransferase